MIAESSTQFARLLLSLSLSINRAMSASHPYLERELVGQDAADQIADVA